MGGDLRGLLTPWTAGCPIRPFTTLYWDFLMRREERLAKNPRMALHVKNMARLSPEKRALIVTQAQSHHAVVNLPISS